MCEIKGEIILIKQTETVGSNGFQKREFVVKDDGQYPQEIPMQFVQDKCSLLDKFQVGQDVTVGINIQGRSWQSPQGETKYFVTLNAWKINAVGQGQQQPQQSAPPTQNEDDPPF